MDISIHEMQRAIIGVALKSCTYYSRRMYFVVTIKSCLEGAFFPLVHDIQFTLIHVMIAIFMQRKDWVV